MRAACSLVVVAKSILLQVSLYRFPLIRHLLAGPIAHCVIDMASCGLGYPRAFSLAGLGSHLLAVWVALVGSRAPPNNSFKPNLLRSIKRVA
jgi:hypothetical protein